MIRRLPAGTDPAAFAAAHQAVLISGAADRPHTLDAFADALDFPDYFGRNLDALLDCLRDLAPAPDLVWAKASALRAADPEGYAGILRVLRQWQAEHPGNRIHLG